MARSRPPKQSFAKDSRTAAIGSTVLLSAFHATLPLFASAILALDAWHVRIVDPTTSSPRNEYALDKGVTCRCLAWGTTSQSRKSEKSKKKRKVEDDSTEGLLAAGTSDGSIYLFNPSTDESIAKLQGGHTGEVLALTFASASVWSAGSDGKVIEWDTTSNNMLRSITVDSSNALRSLAVSATDLLAASYTIHHLTLPISETQKTYTNHTSPVHTLLFGPDNHFMSAADDDRYINVFSLGKTVQEKTLLAESDVRNVAVTKDVLCAVTTSGVVDLFPQPFSPVAATTDKRKKAHVLGASSHIKIIRPDASIVQVVDVSVRTDGTAIVAWSEGARMVFERVNLQDDKGTLIKATEIVRERLPALGAASGAKDKTSKAYHDGNVQVVSGTDYRDLDLGGDDGDKTITNGHVSGDSSDDDEATEEPTLADRLHAMEVGAATPAKAPSSSKAVLKMPSAGSLTTVLTQALKSGDTALLESCLHHSDSKVILTTVRRMDATLAVTLLEQLASRISRRPGRSADLGVWVRWTIVVHGGYLASLPGLVRTLSSLHNVLSNRAAALPRLLALQGRLDMVNSQIELRREGGLLRQNAGADPSDVEYIEGESDISDEEEEEEEIGIEDASQLGGLETSDEEESDAGSDSVDDGDFSEDSGDGNEFAELDAQMEMMQDDDEDDDEGEEEVASDDEAA